MTVLERVNGPHVLTDKPSRDAMNEFSFEEAFELTGHGWFNHWVLVTCGLILLNVSLESVGMSYVVVPASCDLGLTTFQIGLLTAAPFIGIVTTSFVWGYLSDVYGRRRVMLPAIVLSAVFSIASSFATDVWTLLALRVVTGCFVSASSATVYAYLGEMHTSPRRAKAIAWGSAFISFSFILLPGLAWAILPRAKHSFIFSIEVQPWRELIWFWSLPGLLAAISLLLLPESPKFVLAKKSPEDTLPLLARMYAKNHNAKIEEYPVKKIQSVGEISAPGLVGSLNNILYMVKCPLLQCVLISHVNMFAVYLLSSGLYMWAPLILNSLIKSTNSSSQSICEIIHVNYPKADNVTVIPEDKPVCSELAFEVFPISMAMGVIFALVYVAIGLFINKVGKNKLYWMIMVFCGACTVASGFIPNGAVAVAVVVMALCSGCCASILAAISVDVFPTTMRAMAMCTMYMCGRLGAAVGTGILGATLHSFCQLTFSAFGVFALGSGLLILLWPSPERIRMKLEERGFTY